MIGGLMRMAGIGGGLGLGAVPPELAMGLSAGLELAAGAELLGPPPVPPLYAGLLELEGEAAGIPADLLAAVAAVLTGWRPDAVGGLMGLPAELGAETRASLEDLISRDFEAARRVRANVEAAALRLRLYRRDPGGLAGALVRYVREADPDLEEPDARRIAGEIAGAALIYLARRTPADRWEMIGELLGG